MYNDWLKEFNDDDGDDDDDDDADDDDDDDGGEDGDYCPIVDYVGGEVSQS